MCYGNWKSSFSDLTGMEIKKENDSFGIKFQITNVLYSCNACGYFKITILYKWIWLKLLY